MRSPPGNGSADHNGEQLPDEAAWCEIVAATAGQRDPRWWAGHSQEGESQLTDEALRPGLEETANGEVAVDDRRTRVTCA